mgnify:CR=1 FL=1
MRDRNIIVAGGSSGIGRSVVKVLAGENRVIEYSRSGNDLKQFPNAEHRFIDIMSENWELGKLPEKIDGFVYCPGSINLKPFRRITKDELLDDFRLNAAGAFRFIQMLYPGLRKSDHASIVLFSTVAVQTGMAFHSSIAAAKGAVEGLVRSLAAEFAPRIRVNAIAPSLTDTPLASPLLSSDERRARSSEMHPLKRIGTVEDQVNAVKFLLSDDSAWMTGQILHVDGGLSSVRG